MHAYILTYRDAAFMLLGLFDMPHDGWARLRKMVRPSSFTHGKVSMKTPTNNLHPYTIVSLLQHSSVICPDAEARCRNHVAEAESPEYLRNKNLSLLSNLYLPDLRAVQWVLLHTYRLHVYTMASYCAYTTPGQLWS